MKDEFTETVPFDERRLSSERRTIPGEFNPERRAAHRRKLKTVADHVIALTRRFDYLSNRVQEVQYAAAIIKGQTESNFNALKEVRSDLLDHRRTMRVRYWLGLVEAVLVLLVVAAVLGYIVWKLEAVWGMTKVPL